VRVTTRSAAFQQWAALGTNRGVRRRLGGFLVQGVGPIEAAVVHGWPLQTVLHRPGRLSAWAGGIIDRAAAAAVVEVAAPLLAELGGRDDGAPELLAVVTIPGDDLDRITLVPPGLVVVADRPASPGNLGSLVRSADGLGAAGVIVAGHAADPYDAKAVRASRGALFSVPVVRANGPGPVAAWLAASGLDPVALDEGGDVDLWAADLSGPVALVVGNEASGLSAAWRELCTRSLRVPQSGGASSLNAAVAGSLALYEVVRQRARSERQNP